MNFSASPACRRRSARTSVLSAAALLTSLILVTQPQFIRADSVNSPNITLNVDTNRATATGNGAGNVALAVNTITIAETMLPEYSSGTGKAITLRARPGFQFDPGSNAIAQSATIGFNGGSLNAPAIITPSGAADEILTFNLTSGTNASVQDIIRISGLRVRILNAQGAVGPALVTMEITTAAAGGAFANQGIVAATIVKGAPDHLVFSIQPGDSQTIDPILPAVSMVDFGGNIINNDPRLITLSFEDNPGSAALGGVTVNQTNNGVATWIGADNLLIPNVSAGYTLKATHDGADFLTSDEVVSTEFDILAGPPNHLAVTVQPVDTDAGSPILISVSVLDAGDNLVTNDPVDVTLDSAVNPGGWPLLVDTSLTKTSDAGVAAWVADDNLHINKSVTGYQLTASGLSTPVETNAFDITPADPNHLAMTNQPVNTSAGSPILLIVTVQDAFNNTNTESAVDVALNLSANPGGGTLDVGTSLTKAAVDGVARWDAADELHIDVASSGYRILASGVGAADESDAFDILPGGLDHLTMTQQPASSSAGDDLLVTVETRDALENVIPANGVSITLSLSENPGDATLDVGTSLTKETADGLVSWAAADDLNINTASSGYKITANDGTHEVESDAFDITAAVVMDACGTDCGTGSMMTLMPLLLIKLARSKRRRQCCRVPND